MSERAFVDNEATHVFVRELDRRLPADRARRGRVAGGRRGPPLPRRGQRRLDDGDARRGRAARSSTPRRARPTSSPTSTTSSSRRRPRSGSPPSSIGVAPAGPRPRALRDRRRRGERDGPAARLPLPRGARRARPHAHRVAGAGLPRRRRWPRSALTGRPGLWAPYAAVRARRASTCRRRRGASTRAARAPSTRSTRHIADARRATPSRPSSASRSRPPRCRPTRRPTRSGRASPSAASATAS